MAKLYYKFGTMNSSKSANLLMTMYNYESTGKKVSLLQSDKNTRDNKKIVSRAGLSADAIQVKDTDNLFNMFKDIEDLDVILIDEVQFLTSAQINQLALIVDHLNIDVISYGLKSDYLGNLFPAISKLLVLADNISEIKQVCSHCNSKATMNLKVENGIPVYTGDVISIGDTNKKAISYYEPVCRKHYFDPIIKEADI